MRIGMVVAMASELLPFLEKKNGYNTLVFGPRTVYEIDTGKHTVFMTRSGVGQIAAASAAQFLIDKFEVGLLVNFGIAGALATGFSAGQTCVVEKVVHYEMDTSSVDTGLVPGQYEDKDSVFLPLTEKYADEISRKLGLVKVCCASGNKFVSGREREELRKTFRADICEMEVAAVVRVADFYGLDVFAAKTVSDFEELPYYETKELACKALGKIMDEIFGIIG